MNSTTDKFADGQKERRGKWTYLSYAHSQCLLQGAFTTFLFIKYKSIYLQTPEEHVFFFFNIRALLIKIVDHVLDHTENLTLQKGIQKPKKY